MDIGGAIVTVFGIVLVTIAILTLANPIGDYVNELNTTTLGTANVALAQDLVPLAWIFGAILAPVALIGYVVYMGRARGKR